ncbi:MBL fold metallo-hydrolase [soil metagenome]
MAALHHDRVVSDLPAGFDELVPPSDPRATWELPARGRMPVTSGLEPLVSRILAPNASGMTLDGTNSYLVGQPGSGQAVLVDPGPDESEHLDRVTAALAARGARCVAILVTHHHWDHAAAALPWGAHFQAQVAAADPAVAGPGGRTLQPGEKLQLAGTTIEVVPTPGHCGDHLAFRIESGAVLVGDHVLGRGTSVVTYPEGDVMAYLESLRRVHDLGPSALYPGHGPELTENPMAVLDFYLAQRAFREWQILTLLSDAAQSIPALVEVIYADLARTLWPAAEQSTRATLAKLETQGRVHITGDTVWLVG